ncbi:hypothetical protein BGZ83_006621 [Gryganskiella cystojenkinii]|nr:hypothetical protein BGZ83_006621 [Gryganskiella cystojenkinii]
MTLSHKLILSAALAISLMVSTSAAVSNQPQAGASIVSQENHKSPPNLQGATKRDDIIKDESQVPIQYRIGGALGGGSSRHHMGKRGLRQRAVIFNQDPHFEVEDALDKRTDIPLGPRRLAKRSDDDEVEEEEEEDEVGDLESGNFFEIAVDGDVDADADADAENELAFDLFEGEDEQDDEENDDDGEEEDGDDEEEEDEDEERRLDNEAGLQDWIEEMKSEEYFDLTGHPDGGKDLFENENLDVNETYDEDEPSPSEEEIFAASWKH